MLVLLAATLFPFGPAPGPVGTLAVGSRKPWRTLVTRYPDSSVKAYELPQGVLLVSGNGLTLLDPVKGSVRWQASLKNESVESVTGTDQDVAVTVPGLVVHLDPETGQTLRRTVRSILPSGAGNPYPFPTWGSFAWRGGRVFGYGHGGASAYDEDGPVGLAYARDGKTDLWKGGFLRTVVRGPAGTTVGDLKGGEGGDDPRHGYFARAVCAEGEGVWAVRQALEGPGRLVRILPSGRLDERLGPVVDPTQGLPAWTGKGIVYTRAGVVYRFDGRVSQRLLTFPRRQADGSDPTADRLTRWGIVRLASFQRGDAAWTVVRLYPL